MISSIKTTAVFLRPFELPSFNESLPPGEYDIETEILEPLDTIDLGTWTSSVLIHLKPQSSRPGLSRTLTVPLAELEHAVAKDKLTGKPLKDFFLEEMLADPMIGLVMQADGVTESELREFYRVRSGGETGGAEQRQDLATPHETDGFDDRRLRTGTSRPGIGE
ncbi:hypothetical protein [Tropicimonas aquimaris]|uniref:Uncharacterized protein n=1 Tax=Tropicimonas aquimaris TaxID=914152 RepID=A0ABW3IPF8_9RHOB